MEGFQKLSSIKAGEQVIANDSAEKPPQPITISAAHRLPNWPRGMPIALAAAYCGISAGMLRAVGPKPVRISRARVVYLKDHLDRWLDRLAGGAASLSEEDEWAG